jgi:6,7-dimethyl-8-ribityllumazine synthase
MPTERKGDLSAKGLRLAVVVSRFNSFITERLLAGALDALERAGGDNKKIEVVRVPGSFEIPVAAKRLAETGRYDALICLGCIIRGQTQHFDYISAEVTRGIQLAAIETGVPLAFGVLTTDTLEQAIDRAGAKSGNKGAEAALSAVEMANLLKRAGNRSHR